jgi:hypothetical protein
VTGRESPNWAVWFTSRNNLRGIMSEPTIEAAGRGSEQQPMTEITVEGEGHLSVTDAARALAGARQHKPKDLPPSPSRGQQQPGGEQRADGTAQQQPAHESAVEAGATPPDAEVRGETENADPGVQETDPALPPIEPPRSWTKEDKELFTSLPRDTQERIAERERSRESDFLRRQNEAADKLKGLTAKEQAVDQARQQYEAALPLILNTLHEQQAAEFADIKTMADVERLAREDMPRYVRWDIHQKKIADVSQHLTAALARQVLERQQQFTEFAQRQDELIKEKLPEMADDKKAAELQTRCLATLTGLGFAEAELAQSWNGQKDLSLRDHRVQLLIRDATLWREAQAKAKAAQAKPVPPVQRPGVAQPKGAAQHAQIENLAQQLDKSSGVKALRTAAKLVAARRGAR